MTLSTKIKTLFFKEVSIAPLVGFRIIFGALMLFGTIRFLAKGWVNELYIQPKFHFTYLGFDWIKVLPNEWMYLPFFLLVLASLGILLGAFYRISTIVFFLSFTYIELIDKSYYLNHYYFINLIAFWLLFFPANKDFSVDVLRNPKIFKNKVTNWTILIIQIQLGIVYFFAGIAKLNYDWLLEAQPLRIWLQAYRDLPFLGTFFASSFVAFFFSWFGCLYDLTIPFFLSNAKTRKIAYFFVIVFHFVTWLLFPIGVFPWVMIFATLIFFPANFHENYQLFLKKMFSWKEPLARIQSEVKTKSWIVYTLILYIFIQIIIPFRYVLYPGKLFWNEEGFRFSWRVMLMHKEGNATFYVIDRKNNKSIEIENCKYLTPVQEDQMATQSDMILQFAHFLKKEYNDSLFQFGNQSYQLQNPKISAESFVSLNGRPSQLFISKKHDLTKFDYNLKHRAWIETFLD